MFAEKGGNGQTVGRVEVGEVAGLRGWQGGDGEVVAAAGQAQDVTGGEGGGDGWGVSGDEGEGG